VANVSKRSEQTERTGRRAPSQFWKSLAAALTHRDPATTTWEDGVKIAASKEKGPPRSRYGPSRQTQCKMFTCFPVTG
jgi:hypothetical protein